MKKLFAAFVFALTLFTVPAQAETYEEATNALCEKVKECAIRQIRTEDMSNADKRMMMNMMDNMCVGIQQSYSAPPNSPHYNKATACMRSMADLRCAALNKMNDRNLTDECTAFREAAPQH